MTRKNVSSEKMGTFFMSSNNKYKLWLKTQDCKKFSVLLVLMEFSENIQKISWEDGKVYPCNGRRSY